VANSKDEDEEGDISKDKYIKKPKAKMVGRKLPQRSWKRG
jgi:hypothetical protein